MQFQLLAWLINGERFLNCISILVSGGVLD
jgi:hypothetical protein